jgi:hypothetical protein
MNPLCILVAEPSSAPVSSTAQQPPVFQHPVFPQPSVNVRAPSTVLTPNGAPGLSPVMASNGTPGSSVMTNINGVPGPMGPLPVLPQNGGTLPRGPSPVMLPNGTPGPGLLPLSSNSSSGGKTIPSLLSLKTFPSRNLPNGHEPGTTPPSSGLDQQNIFHSKNQGRLQLKMIIV